MTVAKRIKGMRYKYERVDSAFDEAMKVSVDRYRDVHVFHYIFVDGSKYTARAYNAL